MRVIEDAPMEVLASSIVKISEATRKIETSGLNRRALVVLLKAETGVAIPIIERVLNGLGNLADTYTTPKGKAKKS